MSNSPLVTYTKISPNRTSPRNHVIDTISIHCTAGQGTAQTILNLSHFVNYSATSGASCNYAIGKDGSIGLGVPEADRSWCTSSRTNDHRAITIEVSSDSTHPYAVTDEAYNALIDLLVDICQRNNIPKLLWKADKSLIGQVDQQNMTVHRWFANKACPGDYLYNRHTAIANAVNARLGLEDDTSDERKIWDYFLDKLGNKYGVAGLMGNLQAESGLCSYRVQGDYSTGYSTSKEYTAQVDSGAISKSEFINNGPGGGGYGLAQWTYPTRKQGLYEMWKEGGYSSIGSLALACDYLWKELQESYSGVLSVLKSATSIREASDKVLHDFENPADQSESVEEAREAMGLNWYNQFHNYSGGGSGSGGTSTTRPEWRPNTPENGESRKMALWLLVSATQGGGR